MNNIIFLDLDGVLINTFPVRKLDELEAEVKEQFRYKTFMSPSFIAGQAYIIQDTKNVVYI